MCWCHRRTWLTGWQWDCENCFAGFCHIELSPWCLVANGYGLPGVHVGSREAPGPVIGGGKREISQCCWLTAATNAHDSDEATSCVDRPARQTVSALSLSLRVHWRRGPLHSGKWENNSWLWHFGNCISHWNSWPSLMLECVGYVNAFWTFENVIFTAASEDLSLPSVIYYMSSSSSLSSSSKPMCHQWRQRALLPPLSHQL